MVTGSVAGRPSLRRHAANEQEKRSSLRRSWLEANFCSGDVRVDAKATRVWTSCSQPFNSKIGFMAQSSQSARVGVALAVAGMGALCLGFKRSALSLFSLGLRTLELDWRRRHSEFRGGTGARWQAALEFYRETHQNPSNRTLHVVGIPLIVGGAVGLFVSRPLHPISGGVWLGSLGAFGVGWALNLVGHAVHERRAPAFSEDGLSFIAGPVWELQELMRGALRRTGSGVRR
jgi:hypothetical protein